MQMAVKTNVAPRSSRERDRQNRRIPERATGYELGFDICRTLVDEMVDGVMTPMPGSNGNSGLEA